MKNYEVNLELDNGEVISLPSNTLDDIDFYDSSIIDYDNELFMINENDDIYILNDIVILLNSLSKKEFLSIVGASNRLDLGLIELIINK